MVTEITKSKFFALIPCAGTGLRAGGERPKQYQVIAGKAMVLHTIDAFAKVERISQTFVVLAPSDSAFAALGAKASILRCGGTSRVDSVANGLQALRDAGGTPSDWVLVHDAARCLVTSEQINQLIDECEGDAVGGLLACPVPDTLKAASQGRADTTIARADKWAAQTPQMFRLGALQEALAQAARKQLTVTDESSAMEAMGCKPKLLEASRQNFKVTYAEDFALAESILLARGKFSMSITPTTPMIRIGEGWDTHQLVEGRALVLGGVTIPFSKGLLGHSDADALCHAITDALLGAGGLGDIGKHFPDTDPQFKSADSVLLLKRAAALVRGKGWRIGNVDSTVIAQAPKLAPFIAAMQKNISAALELDIAQVNVKAKTAEKMGPVGEELAMEARAVVILC